MTTLQKSNYPIQDTEMRTEGQLKVHNNFRFPIVTNDYIEHRLNEKRNNDEIREKLIKNC